MKYLLEEWKNKLIADGAKFPLYFDAQATNQLDPLVLDEMMPFLQQNLVIPTLVAISMVGKLRKQLKLLVRKLQN